MRENRWNEAEAQQWVARAGSDEADRQLALRVYSSRLIGGDPDLVMHGGGNTSLKLRRPDLFGVAQDVLHIKGSGWDLDSLQAQGMPAVWLQPLLALRSLDGLSDEMMVNVQRANLLDSASPNPSVETLLHAFLPHTVVDHTHATAFLALANLPDAARAITEIFGDRLAIVPYIMPGFALAKAAADVFDKNPQCEGLVLLKHGHFTWGPTACESYERVIAHTNAVEAWLADQKGGRSFTTTVKRERAALDRDKARAFLPALRGAVARVRGHEPKPVVIEMRGGSVTQKFLQRDDLGSLSQRGVGSPDHVIRTKGRMLVVGREDQGAQGIARLVQDYASSYTATFERQNDRVGCGKTRLEPFPCVAWLEDMGIACIGNTAKAASVVGDLAEQTVEVMTLGQAAGGYHPIGEDDLFDMEYWSLEQAKLGSAKPKPFEGQVVLVTGAASGIGLASAQAFAREGAALVLVDRNEAALEKAAKLVGGGCLAVVADLVEPDAAQNAVDEAVLRFGGLDILVSNAGYALQGNLVELSEDQVRQSFELNFFAHLKIARCAADVMRRQGIGGQMLFNVSKQAVNPGKGFGAYGLPKAATFFLVRQLALELGEADIRVNGINADRIRSGLLTDSFIESRAQARGVSQDDYMSGNLLKREVEAHHVADAFVALAKLPRTTAHVLTVDGGNIEAALR